MLHAQALACLARHELAGAGDLECGGLDSFGNRCNVGVLRQVGQHGAHHAGAGHAHVHHFVGLARAVERTGHEGVVLHGVAEHHQLAGTDALAVGCGLGRGFDDAGHLEHGVHVDARARGAHVHRRAHVVGDGQRVGNGLHQLVVGFRGALVHERAEAAHEVDAHLFSGLVHGHGDGGEVVRARGGADLGDGRDGDALVHDGDAVLALELLGRGHEVLGGGGHAVVHLACHDVDVGVRATSQVQPQRDRADVEVLIAHHGKRLGDFSRRDLHDAPSFSQMMVRDAYRTSIANRAHANGAFPPFSAFLLMEEDRGLSRA